MVNIWINLSTRWSLTSVQAALNVIISVIDTVGIWTFARFWWQRAGARVVRRNSGIPLSALFTVSSPGEAWDAITVQGGRLFAIESWHLLLQVTIVILVTLACMLSGPIATLASRTTRTVQKSTLQVLHTVTNGSSSPNLLEAIVLWNSTIEILNQASFPTDQLLDFLPPSTVNWTYVPSEWDPNWSMDCNFTDETMLYNVSGHGNYTFYHPLDAFPVYRDTYDPAWLDTSKYRIQADFMSWTAGLEKNAPFTDVLNFILIESDPAIDDRWHTNRETMRLSLSVLHTHNLSGLDNQYFNQADATSWRPVGPVGNASYTRVECSITRKPEVPDKDLVPWVWTNDTYSITMQYVMFWSYPFIREEFWNLTYATPTGKEILRFYQAYIVALGASMDLSAVFLAFIIALASVIILFSVRYFIFLKRHKSELEATFVPDGKMEWIVHSARLAASGDEESNGKGSKIKDRVYLREATFGHFAMGEILQNGPGGEIRRPSLARVHTRGTSISGPPPRLKDSMPRQPRTHSLSALSIIEHENQPQSVPSLPSHQETGEMFNLAVFEAGKEAQSSPLESNKHTGERNTDQHISEPASASGVNISNTVGPVSPWASIEPSVSPPKEEKQ
ncbi:hypothetical protein IFR05_007200 [Cadophora sp. M221]|nr:hypothetical protein IFR05_007200 [Cadophora sp. M221]